MTTDLRAERDSSNSEYDSFVTNNGITVTIRLSDHNTTVSQFDYKSEKEGISIVISRKDNKGITNDGVAHVVEFFYSDKKLKNAEGNPYAQIARTIQQVLYSGEYKDTTGLAKSQEVNPPHFFRTSSGEDGIRGTGKLIRFSQDIRGTG